MFGIEQFVAVLNPPQAAILAVGATVDTPVVRGGAVEIRPMMTMTLTVDHRAVDGAEGADFLRTVKQFVEDPALACDPEQSPRVWYLVRDFDRGRDFYKRLLGFDETFVDWDDKWSKLERGPMRIALAEGEPTLSGGVAAIDVDDVKAQADRLRDEGVEVGTVLELAGADAARRRLRPGRQPRAAHAGDRVIRRGSAADVPFMRSMLAHAYALARERVRGGHPACRVTSTTGVGPATSR